MAFFSEVISQWKSRMRIGGSGSAAPSSSSSSLRERRVELVHEDAAHGVDDGDLFAGIGVVHEPAAAGGLVGVVDRPQDGPIGVEVVVDLALVPDVVAAGDDVDPAAEQLLGQARGQARPGGGVLAVGDDHVEVELARAGRAARA